MQDARLYDSQAGLKIARRNINNLRYADNTKSLLMKVKEESEKASLKLIIQKTKIMASGPITSWQIDEGNNGNSGRVNFLELQNHCQW